MKTIITLLLILLVPMQSFGQKKSKTDPRDVKIDSLTKASAHLTRQVDSLTGDLKKYMTVYSVISEKIVHYNFDPEKTSFLIDSMKTSRDSIANKAMFGVISANKADSLMKVENARLRVTIDSLKTADEKYRKANTAEDIERAKAIDYLQRLKGLLDAKILTEAEFVYTKKKYLDKL